MCAFGCLFLTSPERERERQKKETVLLREKKRGKVIIAERREELRATAMFGTADGKAHVGSAGVAAGRT